MKLDLPTAIVLAAAIIALAMFFATGGIFQITNTGKGVAFKLNKLTGAVHLCSGYECREVKDIPRSQPTDSR
jgi:hypothetical protein